MKQADALLFLSPAILPDTKPPESYPRRYSSLDFVSTSNNDCNIFFAQPLLPQSAEDAISPDFDSFLPSLLFRVRNLILYIPFGRHIMFVFDFLLRRKCSNFRGFKQETEEFSLEAGRP